MEAFAASGAQLPLTATLGDLHTAIQVLSVWDGDHLHVFHVGGVHYSDPSCELEETEGEQDARLRDMFPPGGPKITYVYDFGADWVHEITRQKMITLEPGQDYPVCVAFGGDFPGRAPVRGRTGGTGAVRPGRGQHRTRQDSPLLIT